MNIGFSNFTNPIRDFVFSAVTTKRKWATPFSPIRGLLKEFTAKPKSITGRALNSGLMMATMMSFDRKATVAMYDEVMLQQLGLKGKALHLVKHPLLPRAFLRFPNRPTRQLNKFFSEHTLLQQRKNAGQLSGSEFLQLKRMVRDSKYGRV